MTPLRWLGCASGLLLLGGICVWGLFSYSSLTKPHTDSYTISAVEFGTTGTFVCRAGPREIRIPLPPPSASHFSTMHIVKGDDGPGLCVVTLQEGATFGLGEGQSALILAQRGTEVWLMALNDDQWIYVLAYSAEERPEEKARE